MPCAIEEIAALQPAGACTSAAPRTQDTELHGAPHQAGDKVTMWYPSVNRDEAVFPDADAFDVGRSPNDHLAFGIGEHFCLGASLARLELNILFEELLRRLPDIALDGPPSACAPTSSTASRRCPSASPRKAAARPSRCRRGVRNRRRWRSRCSAPA